MILSTSLQYETVLFPRLYVTKRETIRRVVFSLTTETERLRTPSRVVQ
jgi:hypothetical protein